jgi:lysophospholipase L1-like esterase
MSRALPVFLLLAFAAAGWLAFEFIRWREGKLAQLAPPPAAAPVAGTPAAPAALLLFGDSRIAQWQPRPERQYSVHVEGFPGATAIRLVPAFDAVLARHRPALVLVQLGVNDAVAASVTDPVARERAQRDTVAAIERMAQAARARGARLVIVDVIPPIRPDPLRRLLFRRHVERFVEAVNAALPAIAARHGAGLVSAMPLLTGPDGEVPERYRKDWLHLTPEAYAALDPLLPATLAPTPEPAPPQLEAATG